MSLSLLLFSNGDTDYVTKHNTNYTQIQEVFNSLHRQISSAFAGELNVSWLSRGLFGSEVARIDNTSYALTDLGDGRLQVSAGVLWVPSIDRVIGTAADTVIDFSELSAGDYYIATDDIGTVAATTSNDEGRLIWSLSWTGSTFLSITPLVKVVWGYETFKEAKTSDALGMAWETLDGRLEVGEGATVSLYKQTIGGNDVTLTRAQAMGHAAIRLQGSQSQDVNLVVPSLEKSYFLFNDCTGGHTVTVKTASGTGITLANGDTALLYCDGKKVIAIHAPSSPASDPYDVGLFVPGKPDDGATVLAKRMPRQVTFPAGLSGSQGGCETAADSQAVFSLRKNGGEFGTATIAAAGTSVSFAAASETVFAAGDKLTVVAPSPQDGSLRGLDITLAGTR